MGRFTIVGVGASAGGLEAFTELLENLPRDSGLGFVLVQHLDPHHNSILAELLAKVSPMPVREAADRMAVKPNHVFVIPPNVDMTIVDGVLRLRRRAATGANYCVDHFLQGLAEDQGEHAIGVILSGANSDGTCGLEAIKSAGGITFAQDASAKHDTMPRSAANSGCVDSVLPPAQIARELVRVAGHSRLPADDDGHKPTLRKRSRDGGASAREPGAYHAVIETLSRHSGVDFSAYKQATLQRRIARRMVLRKKETLEKYLKYLRELPAERDALYEDVLLNVTGFFRDPEAFEALKKTVFPRILRAVGPDKPVRVWVPGCSTGQEAYSLAMSLMEHTGRTGPVQVQIYATDLNEKLLEKARAGFYLNSAVQDVSPERLRRFFTAEEGGYRINKSLRAMCVFARHNLLGDPPFSRMALVSCRNLLIYLDADAQSAALRAFHYSLQPGGLLFLGSSETVAAAPGRFSVLDQKHRIFEKSPVPVERTGLPFPAPRADRAQVQAGNGAFPAQPVDAVREADRVTLKRFSPAGVLVADNFEILQFRGITSPYLQSPTGRATFDLLQMAREGLAMPLRSALLKARKDNRPVRKEDIRFGGRSRSIHIEILPLRNLERRFYLVFFEPAGAKSAAAPAPEAGTEAQQAVRDGETARLRRELSDARDYVRSLQDRHAASNEELQAANEEAQSSNEELQSINEELQTSKEELESSNEELTTVNDELASRNSELMTVTADLNNLHISMDMAMILLGRDLRIRRFTPPAEKLFNLLPTDIGRPMGAVRSNLEFPELESLLQSVINQATTQDREVRDRAGRWYTLRARPYLSVENRIDGAVLTLVDISELKNTQRQIEDAWHFAETVIDTVPPFLILDREFRVKRANRSFCETFQVRVADTEGRLVFDLGNREWDIPKLRHLLTLSLTEKSPMPDFEVEHRFLTIGQRSMSVSIRRLESDTPKDARILLSILDITALKSAEKALKDLNVDLERRVRRRTAALTAMNQDLEGFSYSVAHDLRTPLRAIEGFSRMLSKTSQGKLDPDGLGHLDRIRLAARRMGHLIDALLDLARLSRADLRRVDTNLSAEAASILNELRRRDPERQVEFAIQPGLVAHGDDRLLRIVLTNLLDNAWKFTSKNPEALITVGSLERDQERIYFVRDDGAGFDPAYAASLFTPFHRLHSEQEFPGIGIGLSIVKRIVERHKGRIWAESAPGKGAAFYFTLAPKPGKNQEPDQDPGETP